MINRVKENRRQKKGSSILLLLLLAVIVLFFVLNKMNSATLVEIAAPINLNKNFALPEGTTGILNDGSIISYAETDGVENFVIGLMGEGFFKMNQNQSLIINTDHGKIKAEGASFNVRSWGENLYIECYAGKLSFEKDNDAVGINSGESLNVVNGEVQALVKIRGDAPLWLEGVMRFYEVPMRDVFDEIERQFNVKVVSEKDDRKFSGSFIHFNLNKALEQVCGPMDLKFEIQEGGKVIVE